MAVVPNAKVRLTATARGVVRNAETNAAGIYHFGGVAVGPYTLVVELPRFRRWAGTLTVQAGQTVAVDPIMEVGSLETTVQVTGAAPLVTTEGGAVRDVKDDVRIHNLPLNGRQISNLFDLTPGVEGGGNPRVNGMKVGSTEMTFDGISYVDRFGGGISRVQPGLDAIQEFRVETADSGAQFSRPATVELVTRSGTNQIHGALFETFRNNAAGLRTRQRQDLDIDPVTHKVITAKLIRNEYGGWASGPVIKNKTFWFFNWEGMKRRESNFAITGVPTPAMWGGDLSNITDGSSDVFSIYDPLTTNANGTRMPFPNNVIPTSRISQFAKSMQAISPLPLGPHAADNPWLGPNFQTYYAQPDDQHTFTIKGDQVFSEKDNLSARYTQSFDANSVAGGRYGYPIPGCTNCGGSGRSNSAVFSTFARWNHIFKPTFLNELQLSSHRSTHSMGSLGDNVSWADKLGLPNPFGAKGWPTICTDAYALMYYGCWDGDNRKDQNLTAFQIDDNVTWVKGRHTVKFGGNGRKEFNNVRELQQTEGSHALYSDWTAQFDPVGESAVPFTGNGFATMLLGLPSFLSNRYNRGYFYFQQKELGLYFNDTFKVTPRLTVDYGLRWDAWTPYKEKYDRLVNLDMNDSIGKFQVITPHHTKIESMPDIPPAVLESWKLRGLTWVTANSIGFPSALTPANWRDFGPRLAVAFRVTDKWVLRAGYGTYYWPMPLGQILQSSRFNPPLSLIFQTDYSNLNGAVPFYSLSHVPGPKDFIGQAIVDINHPSDSIPSTSVGMMPLDTHHWADDKMQNWNLTIEREIMRSTSVRLSYVGTHGSNLEQRWRWNDAESEWNYQVRTGLATNGDDATVDSRRPNPNWQSGCCQSPVEHNGYSNSHGVQAQMERRFFNGVAFQAFYVYSRVLTTSDTGGFDVGGGSFNASGQYNGGTFTVPEDRVIMGEPKMSPSQRLRLGYYNSSEVPPHRVRWNGVYDLPFGRGRKFARNASKLTNLIVGGWHLAWIGTWQSGNWSGVAGDRYLFGDPTLSKDQRLTMNIFGRRQRLWFRGDFDPTQATGVDVSKLEQLIPADRSHRILRPLGPNFDNKLPQQLADGSIRLTSVADMVNWNARDFYVGPVQWNYDFSAIKYLGLTERLNMRFTCDFFNLFNHPNDIRPNTTTGLQDLSLQANEPRIIQLSLRLEF
jgi:hypothetical protein